MRRLQRRTLVLYMKPALPSSLRQTTRHDNRPKICHAFSRRSSNNLSPKVPVGRLPWLSSLGAVDCGAWSIGCCTGWVRRRRSAIGSSASPMMANPELGGRSGTIRDDLGNGRRAMILGRFSLWRLGAEGCEADADRHMVSASVLNLYGGVISAEARVWRNYSNVRYSLRVRLGRSNPGLRCCRAWWIHPSAASTIIMYTGFLYTCIYSHSSVFNAWLILCSYDPSSSSVNGPV